MNANIDNPNRNGISTVEFTGKNKEHALSNGWILTETPAPEVIPVQIENAKEQKTHEWKVWSYDTWGNEEDGYTVNDRSEIGTVTLPDDPTDAQIYEAISGYFDISRITIDNGVSDNMHIEIVLEEDEFYPVGQLVRGG